MIAGAIAAARRWPRSPAALLGVGMAVAAGYLLGWHERLLGEITLVVPQFAAFTWTPNDITTVLPSALGLAFVTSVNILVTSRVVEHFQGRHRPSARPTLTESWALMESPISVLESSGHRCPSASRRSLANVRCGGTSRLSNFLHAVFLLALVGYGSSVIARIPLAALAGVTAYVGFSLLEWSTWRRLHRMRRLDATAFLATALAVLTTNAVAAVAIGCSFYVVRHLVDKLPLLQRLPAIETREIES